MSGPKNATRRIRRAQPTGRPLRVLAVTSHLEDQIALNHILRTQRCDIVSATSCAEAIKVLTSQQIPIVVCDHELPDGSWQDILNRSTQYLEFPILIVSSRLADDYLWIRVLNLGGYDVLSKPFNKHEVLRVISSAWRHEASHTRTYAAPQ